MTYSDFTIDSVEQLLGIWIRPGNLFPDLKPAPVSAWLAEALVNSREIALVSEKSRSEFLVAPMLLALRKLSGHSVSIYSGRRLDVDSARGLVGECDFILALADPVPSLRAPLAVVVEAKKHDIEAGLGQCIAQMVAAKVFNDRAGVDIAEIFGCVTTGELWQFLSLRDAEVTLDKHIRFIDDADMILAALFAMTQRAAPAVPA